MAEFGAAARTIAFTTLGCKLNFAESSTLARMAAGKGYVEVPFGQPADISVINTCSVTDHADRKTKALVKEALAARDGSQVVVIGCYAQLKPEEILKIPGVRMVLGANEKFRLLDRLEEMQPGCDPFYLNSHIKEVKEFVPSASQGHRTRSFLKVQDGCNYFCSFCTIPLARGRSRSATVSQVVDEAIRLAGEGTKEIVLTGVNIGDFSNEKGETLLALLKALDKVEGIDRFRISSIEPNLLTLPIIEFVAESQRFVPHFHIPMQSGSNRILQQMRRRYDAQLYESRIQTIARLLPHACIGADVITGFPSENQQDFEDTKNFILGLPLSYLHVFTYSERPNTTAIRIKETVPHRVRKERNAELAALSRRMRSGFYLRHSGTTQRVLWEADQKKGMMYGFTDNYIRVRKPFAEADVNRLETVLLGGFGEDEVLEAEKAA